MTMMLAELFFPLGALAFFATPTTLSGWQRMVLLVPLCFAISVVYKTIRCEKLAQVPLAASVLCVTIVLSMYAVGVGVWLVFQLLA